LVELAVVIVIIGVLAAFGVPRFMKSVERTKASEAFAYLSAIRAAQERYLAKEGNYADDPAELDINQSTMKYFDTPTGADSITVLPYDAGPPEKLPTWTVTLTRDVNTSAYGAYTVVFSQNGFVNTSSILVGSCLDISPLPVAAAVDPD